MFFDWTDSLHAYSARIASNLLQLGSMFPRPRAIASCRVQQQLRFIDVALEAGRAAGLALGTHPGSCPESDTGEWDGGPDQLSDKQ